MLIAIAALAVGQQGFRAWHRRWGSALGVSPHLWLGGWSVVLDGLTAYLAAQLVTSKPGRVALAALLASWPVLNASSVGGMETSLLAFLGGLFGFVLAHGLIGWVIGPLFIEPQTGVSLRFLQFVEYEALLIPGLVILSALAGFLPALAAYRTDVAKALSAAP